MSAPRVFAWRVSYDHGGHNTFDNAGPTGNAYAALAAFAEECAEGSRPTLQCRIEPDGPWLPVNAVRGGERMTDDRACPYDNRECGWFGCHRPECEQFCGGTAPVLDYVDCTCGHPNDDHSPLGECPFPGCGCGVMPDECPHDWSLRPESDTHACDICGEER